MVHVRRPGMANGGGGTTGTVHHNKKGSIFRAVMWTFIALQCSLLLYKITHHHGNSNSSSQTVPQQPSLTDVLHQKRNGAAADSDAKKNINNIRKQPPPQKQQQQQQQRHHHQPVPHDFENKHQQHEDTDDHDSQQQQQHHHGPVQHDDHDQKTDDEVEAQKREGHDDNTNQREEISKDEDEDDDDDRDVEDHHKKQKKHNNNNNNSDDNKHQQLPDVLTQHGSGPAKLGYVVDLHQERAAAAAAFRLVAGGLTAAHYQQRAATVARQLHTSNNNKKENGANLQACEYVVDERALRQRAHCRDADLVLTAYNPAPFARFVCGQEIPPETAMVLSSSDDCEQQHDGDAMVVHLFAHPPAVAVHAHGNNNDDVAPIVIQKETKNGGLSSSLQTVDCDIPCQFDKSLLTAARSDDVATAVVVGTNWVITQTKADPMYQAAAKMERTNYRRDQYYSTTSFQSSVPLAFYDSEKYRNLRKTKALSWSKVGNKATYLLSADCTAGRRNKWLAAVQAVMKVDAFGKCGHNADPGDADLATSKGRLKLMQKNRIVLVLEAGTEKDHITEAVWEALLSGAVPAIYGATNLEKRLPPNSAIFASNYNSWDKFADYVKEVAEDETLWESFHKWRTDEAALKQFAAQWAFTDTPPECRMCRWAYAKQYGLGWNHTQQIVQEPTIARTLCLGTLHDQANVVTKPFREVWSSGGMKPASAAARTVKKEKCTATATHGELDWKDYTVERRVVEHDGVVDMTIQRIERSSSYKDEIVLSLEIDGVRNTDGAYFRDTHTLLTEPLRTFAVSSATIQDDKAKVTVLANWVTEIRSPSEGVVEVVVLPKKGSVDDDEIKRIRVITEDTSVIHDKMTEFFPSTFGRLMMHDFIDPLEFYYEA